MPPNTPQQAAGSFILNLKSNHSADYISNKGVNVGLLLYLIFIVSWFLHLGYRIPLLGSIRFDLILILTLTILAIAKKQNNGEITTKIDKLLRILAVYSILTIPFVEWPGSVLGTGLQNWIKAIVFYYFTISFVKTEKDLKIFVFAFLACQSFRILEPLYLHITEGYWGSHASMANWESMNRLAGSPYDGVNPNGLAFIICSVLPFYYFAAGLSWVNWLVFVCLTPAFLYALILTGSRSGVLGLFIIFLGILVKSNRRLLIGLSALLIVIVGFPLLNPDTQDRYLSIFGIGLKNAATVQGRYEGAIDNFTVIFRRPIFGHGLGTSREVNGNFLGIDQPSHNLYAEVGQELGLVGLIIFVLFIKSIFLVFSETHKILSKINFKVYLEKIGDAMQVWLWMNFVFSFASYGLSSYEWYLFAGFAVVMQRLIQVNPAGNTGKNHMYQDEVRLRFTR